MPKKTENLKDLAIRFGDSEARIETMILLAGCTCTYRLPENIQEFFNEEDFKTIERCLGNLPDYARDAIEDEDLDDVAEWLTDANKLGFLVKFATPIMKVGYPRSWSAYYTEWVYGDTLDDAMDAGFKWVEERRNSEL